MKFMKIGTRPDTFYTEQATRTLISDVPTDLEVLVNNTRYLLHKFPILPKCGLLQRLCSDSSVSETVTIELQDIPGGEDAFELCAKFCYGIMINLSGHNFLPAFCAAKFLRMTESIDKGNFVTKLEVFFNSCILEGWKDSIVTLQTTVKLPDSSENFGIVRKCTDSILEKILTSPAKVNWSYTYTRPGFSKKNHSVPRDWWTEDVAHLDIDLFRCVITAIRSTDMLPPQLIGEALHVYAFRWLPDTTKLWMDQSSTSQTKEPTDKHRKILEIVVSMIPTHRGSVSFGFLARLLSIANYVEASSMTKSELLRRASLQFEEATVSDLLYPSISTSDQHFYDIDLVLGLLENFLKLWRRALSPASAENNLFVSSVTNIGKLIDSYLQVIAKDEKMPVLKFVSLAEAVPNIARPDHDDLYKAINKYLKKHPDLSKAEKKQLCRILDCQKLSPEKRAHAVKNECLPLRTVVQILYFEQEKGSKASTSHNLPSKHEVFQRDKQTSTVKEYQGKQGLGTEDELIREKNQRFKMKISSEGKLPEELEKKMVIKEATDARGRI